MISLQVPTKPVYLNACGACTSIGLSAAQTAVAVRAGISAFEESPILNRHFKPMKMASIPGEHIPAIDEAITQAFPELTERQLRTIGLAHLALEDLKSKFELCDGLPMMIAGSEALPDASSACHASLIEHISLQTGIEFHAEHNALLNTGRAGGIKALYYAMAYLESGLNQYAIVGGVDSYMDLMLLNCLDKENRILAENILDGFVPGEGAGFMVISSEPNYFENSEQQILIYPPGIADEPGHRFSQEVYRGDGLAQSFTLALEQAAIPPIQTILASLNGENFGAKEMGVACTRNNEKIDPGFIVEHPADCFGDIGAAFFPVSIALSAFGIMHDYVQSPILHYASSDTQQRAAVCVSTVS